MSNRVPDMFALIPEGNVKRVVLFCVDTLGLSISEANVTLYNASKVVNAVELITEGGLLPNEPERQSR